MPESTRDTNGQARPVCLIIGSAGGSGRATAEALREGGSRVIIASRSRDALEDVAESDAGREARKAVPA